MSYLICCCYSSVRRMFDTQLIQFLNPWNKKKKTIIVCVFVVLSGRADTKQFGAHVSRVEGELFGGNTWGLRPDPVLYFTNMINKFPQESPVSPVFTLNLQTSFCRLLHHYLLKTFRRLSWIWAQSMQTFWWQCSHLNLTVILLKHEAKNG